MGNQSKKFSSRTVVNTCECLCKGKLARHISQRSKQRHIDGWSFGMLLKTKQLVWVLHRSLVCRLSGLKHKCLDDLLNCETETRNNLEFFFWTVLKTKFAVLRYAEEIVYVLLVLTCRVCRYLFCTELCLHIKYFILYELGLLFFLHF